MRSFPGIHFGGIEVKDQDTFTSRNGKKYLVTHGDQFDTVIAHAKWLAYLGDRAYGALIWLNPKINRLLRLWKQEYWSLSKWSKQQVKQAVSYIGKFEQLLADDARGRGFDGVICGHIHHAAIRDLDGIVYVNTGDWVESCTAIVEDPNGILRLIDWEARNTAMWQHTIEPKARKWKARVLSRPLARTEKEQA
ncbi:MAG: UDP-2,3-diacylglucosamine diphosphatase, partial [Pseudomonadota bacterium]